MFTAYRKDETEVHIRDRECPIIFQPKVWAVYWLLFYLFFSFKPGGHEIRTHDLPLSFQHESNTVIIK